MPSRTIAVTPAPQSPASPQSPAPDAEASAEYAALLHTAAEAETALRRYEAARGAQLRVPDERRMARLLSDAQSGPMTKEAQRAESERAAAMRMLHAQALSRRPPLHSTQRRCTASRSRSRPTRTPRPSSRARSAAARA